MRILANLFMWMFLADGCLSVIDELLAYNSGVHGLLGVRTLVAFSVVVLAIIVYGAMFFDRRLPKLILLPQSLFAIWGMTGLWPLSFFILSDNLGVMIAGLQVSLGLLPFFVLRGEGRGLLLRPERFFGRGFSVGNLLLGVAGTLFVVPLLLVSFAGAGTVEAINNATAGFMRVDARGISMQERVYRRGDKTVRLVAMIHVGDQSYYDQLAASVAAPHTLVLAEGVSDRGGLLTAAYSYDRVASLLGLSTQRQMPMKGRLIDPDELRGKGEKGNSQGPDILRADVDLSDFDPRTVEFLNMLGRDVFSSDDLASGLRTYNAWINRNMDQERYARLMDDILTRRNRTVLDYLGQALDKYDVIVIPWGALHMRGIEEGVLARGFRLRKTEQRMSVDFSVLLKKASD
ncbi:hypothetical protein C2E25_09280 [Geothermobacter hydrogeniphilus]|uniref:TraB family protein n=1 Tax=Geothermobacter hydrogeniphilus TaxID=1969733 RepID=A0A2K2H9W3_9BACT|nr:hypothetical protein [Geothermobacter hydrogeniphilus]PNU20096.1 hypothetical protein C2E25_09280 [Geothermobacter hydrogeniphilus]